MMIMRKMNKFLVFSVFGLVLSSCSRQGLTCTFQQMHEVLQNIEGKIEYNENLMQYVFVSETRKYVSDFGFGLSFYDSNLKKYCYQDYKEYGEYMDEFTKKDGNVYADFRTSYQQGKKKCFVLPSFPELEKEYPGYTGKSLFHLYLEKNDPSFYSSSYYDYLGIHSADIDSIYGASSSSESDK